MTDAKCVRACERERERAKVVLKNIMNMIIK